MIYTASFEQVAVTAVQDLWEILVPADAVLELLEIQLSQDTEEGDAQDEQLYCTLRRVTGAPSSGSAGGTPVARPHMTGWPASGCTIEANNTSQLSGGTNVVLRAFAWNIRAGELYMPIPEGRFFFSPAERLLLELETAPTDSVTMSGSITWREIGG